ncbi:MAG: hypothetical protein ABF652_05395 [Clostridium beijerinckii]
MIKIKLSNKMLKSHKDYIIELCLEDKFNELKINQEILEKLPNDKYIIEHQKFCEYIINEVQILKNNCFDEELINNSIFLADSRKLHDISKQFEIDFPLLSELFKKDNKNENEYKDTILNCIGYKSFSGKNLTLFFKPEMDMYKKYSKSYIKSRLKEIKPINEKYYKNQDYDAFVKEIVNDINYIENLNEINKAFDNNLNALKSELRQYISQDFSLDVFVKNIKESLEKWIKNYENGFISINNYKDYLNRCINEKIQWSAYSFVFELGIKVCPYCNRQYISPIYSESGKVRADLDHFYAKSRYPYLSMSIHNLIPCCKFCNSSLKGDKEFTYENNISPYDKDIDDYMYFDYYPLSSNSFYGQDEVKIELKEKDNVDKDVIRKFRNNLRIFQVEELYQYHTDLVKLMLKKRMVFTDKYLDNFYNKYRTIFKSREEMINILFGSTFEGDEDSPFSKLKKDMINQIIYSKLAKTPK